MADPVTRQLQSIDAVIQRQERAIERTEHILDLLRQSREQFERYRQITGANLASLRGNVDAVLSVVRSLQ